MEDEDWVEERDETSSLHELGGFLHLRVFLTPSSNDDGYSIGISTPSVLPLEYLKTRKTLADINATTSGISVLDNGHGVDDPWSSMLPLKPLSLSPLQR